MKTLLARISRLLAKKPAKLFLMVGINDLLIGSSIDSILDTYAKLLIEIRTHAPNTELTVFGLLPTRQVATGLPTVENAVIKKFNQGLRHLVHEMQFQYFDLHSDFVDASGRLREGLTLDGIHLNGQGYILWKSAIENHIGCGE